MEDKFIVAIGSSAGGLAPMITYFEHTPHDNATYIIVRHIPPNQRSYLHEILQKHSKLKITEAENHTLIEKDFVYMPPPGMYMTIEKNYLSLSKRLQKNMYPNESIDIFFKSVALAYPDRCIGIVLSGMGTDGTDGAIAIKAAGGIVLVQRPSTCEQRSMPENVINSGMVDSNHILDPAAMSPFVLSHINIILKNANQTNRLLRASDRGKKK